MGRRRPPTVHGVTVVDKPAGVTSHDVVSQLRRRFGERRVGHAGTLDPDATGVLVVALGHATRLLRFVGDSVKSYTGEVVLGVETDTLDSAGTVVATHDMASVDLDEVRRLVAEHLTGPILQVPPMVSALKVDGRRLHELHREGVEVEREPRPVTVHRFEVDRGPTDDVLCIDVDCSAGTYIRTLAADLGRLLGGGAHLRNLRRTAVGRFTIDEARPPDDSTLLPVIEAVRALERHEVDEAGAIAVGHGRPLPAPPGAGPWAVVGPTGALLAVYEADRRLGARASVVLPTETSG